MEPAILYTLIIVTMGGDVKLTQGITSFALCEDARQVAETGRTVAEEKRVRDAQIAAKPARKPGDRSLTAFASQMRIVGPSDPKFAKCVIMPESK